MKRLIWIAMVSVCAACSSPSEAVAVENVIGLVAEKPAEGRFVETENSARPYLGTC